MGHYASEIGPNDDFLRGKVAEPTPKPTDALDHLRRLTTKEEVWSYLEAAIAAWEKERAAARQMYDDACHEGDELLSDLKEADKRNRIMRTALERIEGEMREQYRIRKAEHPNWRDDFTPKWADELRAAREPNRPQGESDEP